MLRYRQSPTEGTAQACVVLADFFRPYFKAEIHVTFSLYLTATSVFFFFFFSFPSSCVSADLSTGEGAPQGEGTFSLSPLPPMGAGPFHIIFFLFLSGLVKIFLIAPLVQDLLLEFSRCSVRIGPLVDVFLIYLWERVSSHTSILPS